MNFGGMPRGGGRKVTRAHRFVLGCVCVFVFDATATLLCVAAVRAAMRREIQSIFFFSCFFRARVYRRSRSLLSQRWSLSLSLFAVRRGDRVFQNALFLRERERERQTDDVFSDLPKGKKKREKTNAWFFTQNETKCKREEKKTNRQPKHIKERERAERERERERERVFF